MRSIRFQNRIYDFRLSPELSSRFALETKLGCLLFQRDLVRAKNVDGIDRENCARGMREDKVVADVHLRGICLRPEEYQCRISCVVYV